MHLMLRLIHLCRDLRTGKIHLPPSLLFGRKKTPSSDSIPNLASLVCLCLSQSSFFNYFLICLFFWFIAFNKKKEKSKKYKTVCVCVYWYLCTFGLPLKQGFLTLYLL